jgi:hypothetical protein
MKNQRHGILLSGRSHVATKRLALGNAVIDRLSINELEVKRLRVQERITEEAPV